MPLTKKLLTPAKFGLNTMKPLTSSAITRIVTGKINSLKVSPAVKNAMHHMVKNSASGNPSFSAQFTGLFGSDVGILTSDFGEVTGALYMLNSGKGYTAAKFPTSEAQKLVDYYLIKDGVDEKFSAKAGEGGAPSIIALENALNDLQSLNRKQLKAREVLQILNKESVYDGVLVAAKFLNLPGYQELTNILKKRELKTGYTFGEIPTQENLINAIDSCGTFNSCMKQFNKLFEAADFELGGDRGIQKMKSVFAGTAGTRYKKWGLLHYPITSEVKSWLNDSNNCAKEVLTLAARTLTVNQVYLDHTPKLTGTTKWNSGKLNYIIKTYADSDFEFHSPSSAPNPVGNRIGMRMIKG